MEIGQWVPELGLGRDDVGPQGEKGGLINQTLLYARCSIL